MRQAGVRKDKMLSSLANIYFDRAYGYSYKEAAYESKGEGSAENRALLTWVKFELFQSNHKIINMSFHLFAGPYTIAVIGVLVEKLLTGQLHQMDNIEFRKAVKSLSIPRDQVGKIIIVEDAFFNSLKDLKGDTW